MSLDVAAVRELALLDWGTPLVLQVVEQTYDPQTQAVVEEITETELVAIAGPAEAQPAAGTGGQHQTELRTFLIAVEDWPTVASSALRRLKAGDVLYDVLETKQSAAVGLLLIVGRRQ